jgi:hypothetical protein
MEHDFSKTICKVRRGLPGGLISSETPDEPGVGFQFNLPPETSYKFLKKNNELKIPSNYTNLQCQFFD